MRMTKVGVGYNIQLAIDVKHKLIAEQAVSKWGSAVYIARDTSVGLKFSRSNLDPVVQSFT
ncbi:hypothetical protein E5673_14310 [Sphingomonas sp. PAMC26645]|nr:hypothetical protein E5673_14310 [Sphingomonas sp. PAMC26645]